MLNSTSSIVGLIRLTAADPFPSYDVWVNAAHMRMLTPMFSYRRETPREIVGTHILFDAEDGVNVKETPAQVVELVERLER